MAEDFIRDLTQKLADENAKIAHWDVCQDGSGATLTVSYELTPEQSGYLHCIAEKEAEDH